MCMTVDEPRHDHRTSAVDDLISGLRSDLSALLDASLSDADPSRTNLAWIDIDKQSIGECDAHNEPLVSMGARRRPDLQR